MTKEELYLSILDNIQDGVYYVDIHRKIKFWNKGAEQITGYQADEMVGLDCPESKLNHIDEYGNHLCITGCPLFATNIDGVVRTEKVFVRHKNGYRIPLLTTVYPIRENGVIVGSVEVFTRNSPKAYDDNEGSNNITVEIGGYVYEVEAETYEHIFRDELWDAGNYSASFASINGMEGTVTCYTYKYRLEVTGRLNNAVEDTTYVILSNIENITFEQAWKASGLSSNTADYFDPAEAVFINRTR